MAAKEQSHNIPRIFEVQDPGANMHVVMVLMPTDLASKYPSKPWGTPIDKIGLSQRDAGLFPGYVLVDFEPVTGSSDLFWIFQNLTNAPTWTTRTNSRDNLTPAKFRGQVSQAKTKQDVAPGTLPDTMSGDLVASTVEQQDNTGKAIKVTVTEVIAENSTPLMGQQFAPDGTLLAIAEALVVDGVAADKGLNVAQSTVDPLGNGKSIKQTSTAKRRPVSGTDTEVDGWPKKQKKSKGVENLTPSKFRGQITTSVTTTQETLAQGQVDNIPDPSTPVAPETVITHEKVNDYRYEKSVTTEVIAENAEPLTGKTLTNDGDVAIIEESLIETGGLSDVITPDFNLIDASTDPLGNGKSIKKEVTVSSFSSKSGTKWDATIGAQIPYTEQAVDPATLDSGDFELPNVSFNPVTAHRSIKVTTTPPTSTIESILRVMPAEDTVDLPNTLLWAKVMISRILSNSNGISSGGSSSVANSSQVAIAADIDYEIVEGFSGSVPAEIMVFYRPIGTVTKEEILAVTGSLEWPNFQPRAGRLVISGHGVSKGTTLSVSDNGESLNEHSDIQAMVSAISFPPCIHDEIQVEVEYNDLISPTGMADEIVDEFVDRTEARNELLYAALAKKGTIYGLDTSIPSNYAAVKKKIDQGSNQTEMFSDLSIEDFPVTLSRESFPATTPPAIIPGRYLKKTSIRDWDYGYEQITAVVVIIP